MNTIEQTIHTLDILNRVYGTLLSSKANKLDTVHSGELISLIEITLIKQLGNFN